MILETKLAELENENRNLRSENERLKMDLSLAREAATNLYDEYHRLTNEHQLMMQKYAPFFLVSKH